MNKFSKRQAYEKGLVLLEELLTANRSDGRFTDMQFNGFGALKELLLPLDNRSAWGAEDLRYEPEVTKFHELLRNGFGNRYDEAVSSLDVLIQEQLINLLVDLQKKFPITYFFISHNLRVVKKISHRVAVMFRGKIVEIASAEEIFRNPLHPYTKELLQAALNYQPVTRDKDIVIPAQAGLVDRGHGHFVLQEI